MVRLKFWSRMGYAKLADYGESEANNRKGLYQL
jgi:hypothetical protein